MDIITSISGIRTTIVAIVSLFIGTVVTVDVALQRLAWTVAIIAGCIGIFNGIRNMIRKRNHHTISVIIEDIAEIKTEIRDTKTILIDHLAQRR